MNLIVFLLRSLMIMFAVLGGITSSLARPHIVVDANSGKVISHSQAFDRWHPASLTKMMTAYVVFTALEKGEITLQSPVRVSKYALSKPPSKMGLPVGTILNVDNALKTILVKSANDISVAMAESLAGSEVKFARRMNQAAAKLGMTGSHFINPHGLHAPLQYTTARDMALLALALHQRFPQYAHYFKIARLKHGKNILRSYNRSLEKFAGADGFKTGYVCASGYNIVAAATRKRRRLIAVVLGEQSSRHRNLKAARLLSEAFVIPSRGQRIAKIKPYGTARYVATNLRDEVCQKRHGKTAKKETKKQRNARYKAENQAFLVEEVKYFHALKRGTPVRIVLGQAFGPNPTGIKVKGGNTPPSYVAVPTPRPRYHLARIDDLPPRKNPSLRGSVAVPTFRQQAVSQ